jgi:hypothetical protein
MKSGPNFFIAGAPKAGTSSLSAYLQALPGVYMSRLKEPNYFSRVIVPDDHPLRPIRDERRYLQLFADAGNARVVGEASPTYLADPGAAGLIKAAIPHAKVLVSLRDPVERAYSHYLMMLNNGTARGTFLREIKRGLAHGDNRSLALLRADVGLYCAQVERFHDAFGDAQFQVLIFEEFSADVPGSLRQVCRFLGLAPPQAPVPTPAYREYSVARGPLVRFLFGNRSISRATELLVPATLRKAVRDRLLVKRGAKPAMEPEAREFLREFYSDDVRSLERLLGRKLPWRNFLTER